MQASQYTGELTLSGQRPIITFVVSVVFCFTSTLSLVLRLVAKRIRKLRLASEDYTIIAAQVRFVKFSLNCSSLRDSYQTLQIAIYGMFACVMLGLSSGQALNVRPDAR